jgi:hypothetical protein
LRLNKNLKRFLNTKLEVDAKGLKPLNKFIRAGLFGGPRARLLVMPLSQAT